MAAAATMGSRFWLRTRKSQIVGAVAAAIALIITYRMGLAFMLAVLLIGGGITA